MRSTFNDRSKLWTLYSQAKAWTVRPSELLDVSDGWAAYCLDNAVWTFGEWVISELDKVPSAKKQETTNKRREAKLKAILADKPELAFADPAAKFKKT